MSEKVRLFAAIDSTPSDALREVLARLGAMGRAVRPTREGQLHVTLKFFGDLDADVVPALAEELTQIAADAEPFDWALLGTGAFPSPARPSVVWAGVDAPDRFAPFAERLEAIGEVYGVSRERRPFHPHVTLARIKFRPPSELMQLLNETAGREFGRQRADRLVLYRSDLGPGGSTYTPLHVAAFGGSKGPATA